MTNGNSAELKPSQKWTDRQKAVTEWENKIACHGGRNVTTREIACFEDGFEAAREMLSVCADGGKGEAVSVPRVVELLHKAQCTIPALGTDVWTVTPIQVMWVIGTLLKAAPQTECAPRDRASSMPGGCECSTCGRVFIGGPAHSECGECAPREVQPFGWANEGSNYFTRSDLTAKRIGGMMPVYAAPTPERAVPPYSAPFTTDVPQCCGDPETCDDPCTPERAQESAGVLTDDQVDAAVDAWFEAIWNDGACDFRVRMRAALLAANKETQP
jgi:hypothetical protein